MNCKCIKVVSGEKCRVDYPVFIVIIKFRVFPFLRAAMSNFSFATDLDGVKFSGRNFSWTPDSISHNVTKLAW
ncbi:MAG: hypothetical protein IPN18_18585 [Ignavibacteriales bacterium]|nr:hypothetical protein [Ignavibacteriales bacterium]